MTILVNRHYLVKNSNVLSAQISKCHFADTNIYKTDIIGFVFMK